MCRKRTNLTGWHAFVHITKITLLTCVFLGCQSTADFGKEKTDLGSTGSNEASLLLSSFNTNLEDALNKSDEQFLNSKVNTFTIAEKISSAQPALFNNPKDTYQTALEVKQQFIAGILELSKSFTWQYMYYEKMPDDSIAAYYRVDNDESYSYITFWLSNHTFQIYDYHPISFQFSALEFLTNFTQMFMTHSDSDAHSQLAAVINAVQSNDQNQLLQVYLSLDEKIRLDPTLNDFILRKLSQTPNKNATELVDSVAISFERNRKTSLFFEAHYLRQENFGKAIAMLQGLPKFALQDSKMQSELAVLHAYNEDFLAANTSGNQAIQTSPLDEEAYFALLQVSLLAQDYTRTTQILDTLITKFDYLISHEVMVKFDQADLFLRSEEFISWARKLSAG